MVRLRLPLFPVLVVGIAAYAAPAPQNAPQKTGFAALQDEVVEHTLKNGLRLILLPRHEVPVFSFATVADVGSVDEHVGITGIAHMFEHMAFKGTTRIGTRDWPSEQKALARVDEAEAAYKQALHHHAAAEEISRLRDGVKKAEDDAEQFVEPNEFTSVLERFGANGLNASTGFDFTSYFYSLPSNKLELWMSLESDRFLDPVLREFYKERDVVKEERNQRIDSNPIGRLLEEFLGVAYNVHPYANLGIGCVSDLDSFTRQDALEFYRKHYVPENLIVAVVGDVDPEKTIAMAETYFGRLSAGPEPDPVDTVEPRQNSERRTVVFGESQRIALIGYHKPSALDRDEPVYDAMSSILSSGRTSRLYRTLVRDKKIATTAGGFGGFPGQKYPNMFLFYAFAAPGHTNEEVLAAMDDEISKLQNEPVTEQELHRVKAKAKAGLVAQLASNPGMALQLAQEEALSGDWRELFRSIDKINAVKAEDIQRVARETFRKSNRTIALLETEPPKPAGAAASQGD
jgi:predicted Zn-dependent peptidase